MAMATASTSAPTSAGPAYPSALDQPPFFADASSSCECLLACPACSPQPTSPCCPLPFLPGGRASSPLTTFLADCQECSASPTGDAMGGLGVSVGSGAGGGKSHLAFCCDDEACLPGHGKDSEGRCCEVGCSGGSGGVEPEPRSWEQMMLDDCAQCLEQQGSSTGLGLIDASCCSTSWLDNGGGIVDPFADCRTAGCFDPGLEGGQPQDDCPQCADSSSGGDSSSTPATSLLEAPSTDPSMPDLDRLLQGLDESAIQDILNCCCCEEVLHGQPSAFDPTCHANHRHLPQHIHCAEHHSLPPPPHPPLHSHQPYHDLSHHVHLPDPFSAMALPTHPHPHAQHTCGWAGCHLSFGCREELVMHVNTSHLSLPSSSSAPILPMPSSGADSPQVSAAAVALSAFPGLPPLPEPTAQAGTDAAQITAAAALKQVPLGQLAQLDPVTALAIFSSVFAGRPGLPSSIAQPTPLSLPEMPQMQFSTSQIPTKQQGSAYPGHPPHLHPQAHTHSHVARTARSRHVHSHPYGVASTRQRGSATSSVAESTSTMGADLTPAPLASLSSPSTSMPLPSSTHNSPVPAFAPLASTSASPACASNTHQCRWLSCGLSFPTSSQLMEHLSTAHVGSGKARYTCEWDGCERSSRACEERGDGEDERDKKGFRQRQKIMRHLQMHTRDRPFACDVCGKTFSEALTLTQHMRVHTQERPYACDHPGCGKTFALASALTIHKRTHTGARPFTCPHPGCTAAFAESSNLSKHIRTHGSERRYVCPVEGCGKAFGRSDQLKRHGKVHARKKGGQEEEGEGDEMEEGSE
ncbi:hypothetical protein JCM5296_000685 [Sporobolomyces johnsonii]